MNELEVMANAGAEGAKAGRAGLDLIGKVFGPTFTRRQAAADAQAAIQFALVSRLADHIESNPLDPNVLEMLATYGGKASVVNLANILCKALPMLDETVDSTLIADDWIANWRDRARLVSDEEMSLLWAQLLAGEVNSPGTYSPKAVNMLADMDKSNAQLFHDLCRFQVMRFEFEFGPRDTVPLVIDPSDEIYKSNGVTDEGLLALEDIGLIRYPMIPNIPDRVKAYAYSRGWLFIYSPDHVETGRISWTYNGKQMSKLCLPLESPAGFEQYLLDKWGANRDIRHHAELTVQFKQGALRACPQSATVFWH
ncbi:MAG: DUF2806 domain-containing protein [Caldilineaceae bacterium]|nr:DUF2806 domain-containing protein [Caldilineaceae bacterium]